MKFVLKFILGIIFVYNLCSLDSSAAISTSLPDFLPICALETLTLC